MERLPADVLGDAVEKIIRHSQALNRDRTDLAHALSKVQDQLVQVRQEYQDLFGQHQALLERQAILQEACQSASLRLERMADALEKGSLTFINNANETEKSLPSDPEELAVAERVVKPLDISSFQRIVRQAGGLVDDPPRNKIPITDESEAVDEPKCDSNIVLESLDRARDRLF